MLVYWEVGDEIVLASRRAAFDWQVHRLSDHAEVTAFRLLDNPHSPSALARKLPAGHERVAALLHRWTELGLLFTDEGHYVHVATAAGNQHLLHPAVPASRPQPVRVPA